MADGDEEFARLTLEGARFDHARLPVDALEELQRYRRLVLIAARQAWTSANSGADLPEDFDEQFDLTIVDVEEGSAISVLDRPAGPYATFYDQGRDELERELAAALTDEALEASMNDLIWEGQEAGTTDLPEAQPVRWSGSLPLASLQDFRDLGSSLRADESLKLPTDDVGVIALTPENRERNLLPIHERTLREVTPTVSKKVPRSYTRNAVAGRLVMLDADLRKFDIETLLYGRVPGKYKKQELTEDLRAVLDSSAQAPVVRVNGRLSYAGADLKRVLEATSVELLEVDGKPYSRRFIELASLAAGWGDDGVSGEMISFSALDAARDFLDSKLVREVGLPGIFPMEDGGVQLEWATSERVSSVEITPDLDFELFDLKVAGREATHHVTKDFKAARRLLRRLMA